ncbi:MAG TPA: TetR/AcrR family transcriptional regulator [Solirubrobacteraceae bacterium]
MIESTDRHGYAEANIRSVIAGAGVSRPTFYDYFEDHDACFTAAINDVQAQAEQAVAAALRRPGTSPQQAALRALVELSAEHPKRARFLMEETMAGGRLGLNQRDQGVARIARAIDQAAASDPAKELVDLPTRVLVGTAYRLIGTRLRRGEALLGKLADELDTWVSAYMRPPEVLRWTQLEPGVAPPASPHVPDAAIQQMPAALPPGRPALKPGEVAENHRLRILHATASLAASKGYAATTVTDIIRSARIDGRAYYRLFTDKRDAFTAMHESGFRQVMDVTAKAYFSVQGWPQRSWEVGRALMQLLEAYPLIARLGFVEAYAVGPSAVQRIQESQTAFGFFLQEGLMEVRDRPSPTQAGMEAIVAAIFEIIYLAARPRGRVRTAGLQPHVAHVWLAPFLGPERCEALIDARMRTRPSRRKPGVRRDAETGSPKR